MQRLELFILLFVILHLSLSDIMPPMTEKQPRSAAQELSLVTKWRLRENRTNNVELIESLGWLGSETQEEYRRVQDFEFVNQRLNELLGTTDIPPKLRDAGLLAKALNGRKIPTLEEARTSFYADPEIAGLVTATIDAVVNEYSKWAKVNPEHPSKGTPASGALIEGFGAFLSLVSESPVGAAETSRCYVLAFEEVLITERPDSPLVYDVIGWMKEKIESFPEEIQPIISNGS
jgi:hypothetical protein